MWEQRRALRHPGRKYRGTLWACRCVSVRAELIDANGDTLAGGVFDAPMTSGRPAEALGTARFCVGPDALAAQPTAAQNHRELRRTLRSRSS